MSVGEYLFDNEWESAIFRIALDEFLCELQAPVVSDSVPKAFMAFSKGQRTWLRKVGPRTRRALALGSRKGQGVVRKQNAKYFQYTPSSERPATQYCIDSEGVHCDIDSQKSDEKSDGDDLLRLFTLCTQQHSFHSSWQPKSVVDVGIQTCTASTDTGTQVESVCADAVCQVSALVVSVESQADVVCHEVAETQTEHKSTFSQKESQTEDALSLRKLKRAGIKNDNEQTAEAVLGQ